MLSIVLLLNVLTETLRKKVTDVFPVILSTPHRETEFFLLFDPMFDFIIRHTLKNANTNTRIERFATNTLDSFIKLMKYGFEDPTNMSYDTLFKKTKLILDKFFNFLRDSNLENIASMYNPDKFYKLIELSMRSDLTDEILRSYPFDDYSCNGLCFSIEADSQCVSILVEHRGFAQIHLEEHVNLFNLPDNITSVKLIDGTWTSNRCIQDKCDYLIGDFPEMEDNITRRNPNLSKRKLRKQRNAIVFH